MLWIDYFYFEVQKPLQLHIDNKSTIHLTNNPVSRV